MSPKPILEEWIEMVENDIKIVMDFIENPRNQK